jgi:7-cyano-7-deazaguanine synthase in queuosine biosynthesis
MMQTNKVPDSAPRVAVDVVEGGGRSRKGWLRCEIEQNVKFDTASLETYCFASWDAVVYDALLMAAAAEFADRSRRRPASSWAREIALRIPVHDPARWSARPVADALRDALAFLTGDRWEIAFYKRRHPQSPTRQVPLTLPPRVNAVIPFSDGLDSCAVAGLMRHELCDTLIRVRLGAGRGTHKRLSEGRYPFTSVPYQLRPGSRRFVESSARSRGFKFALVSGLAAYLAKAATVIVPESGQGALGPALIPVGQGYEDYRSHPLFTDRMEKFLTALLGHRVQFQFPRLWYSKAETLKAFVDECDDESSWSSTSSCWQQSRQVSVEHRKRQCGICAACMLRRMSVHAAGLAELPSTYVWEDLSAPAFESGAVAAFPGKKVTRGLREYAIAGVLHMDHLAALRTSTANAGTLDRSAFQLGRSLGLSREAAGAKLTRLLMQHEREWKAFVNSLGQSSFVANWASCVR